MTNFHYEGYRFHQQLNHHYPRQQAPLPTSNHVPLNPHDSRFESMVHKIMEDQQKHIQEFNVKLSLLSSTLGEKVDCFQLKFMGLKVE